jgi:hypothetical protein
MKQYLICIAMIVLTFANSASFAQEERAATLEQRMEEARARLNLTDSQVEAITPVLEESMVAQQSILSRYGVDLESGTDPMQKLGRRTAMTMKKELDSVRTDTLDAVGDILTEEQFEEFKRLQRERQAEMRKRMRGGR